MSKSWSEEMVYRYQKEIQLLTKERDKLKKELSISNKALKLACAKLLSIYCSNYCGETSNCEKINCEYEKRSSPDFFKTKAEESMKNEVNND